MPQRINLYPASSDVTFIYGQEWNQVSSFFTRTGCPVTVFGVVSSAVGIPVISMSLFYFMLLPSVGLLRLLLVSRVLLLYFFLPIPKELCV